jgi:hypothetical protein
VFFVYAQTMDPYGDDPDLPDELSQVGREYFAYNPRERVAVSLGDLPEEITTALDEKRAAVDAEGWRRPLG